MKQQKKSIKLPKLKKKTKWERNDLLPEKIQSFQCASKGKKLKKLKKLKSKTFNNLREILKLKKKNIGTVILFPNWA